MNINTYLRTGFVFAVFSASLAVAQTPVMIENNDHRPLAGALDKLQVLFNVAINYEDLPSNNILDLEDVSTPQQRQEVKGFRNLVPRKGAISSSVVGTSDADKMFSIGGLLNSYRNASLPGDFEVERANGAFYVIPKTVLSADGSVQDVVSPMKVLITIPSADRTAIATEAAILNAVTVATSAKIVIGTFPFQSPGAKVTLGAEREPARDVLARFFAQVDRAPTSYRLLYDPMFHYYMLNAQIGPLAVPESNPAPVAPTVPGKGPYFGAEGSK